MRIREASDTVKATHVAGLLLWRGGLLLAGGTVVVITTRFLLRFFTLPAQMEVGLALLSAGFLLILTSLIAERVQDLQTEREDP